MRKFRVWDKEKRRWVKKDETNLVWPVLTPDGTVMVVEFSAIDDSAEVLDEGGPLRFEVNFYSGLVGFGIPMTSTKTPSFWGRRSDSGSGLWREGFNRNALACN